MKGQVEQVVFIYASNPSYIHRSNVIPGKYKDATSEADSKERPNCKLPVTKARSAQKHSNRTGSQNLRSSRQ